MTAATAVYIADFYSTRTPQPATSDTLLVLTADGKGVVMRPDSLGRRPVAPLLEWFRCSATSLGRARNRTRNAWPPSRRSMTRHPRPGGLTT